MLLKTKTLTLYLELIIKGRTYYPVCIRMPLFFRGQPAEGSRHSVPVPSGALCSCKSQVRLFSPAHCARFTVKLDNKEKCFHELEKILICVLLGPAVRSNPVRGALRKERRRRLSPVALTSTPPPHRNPQGKVRLSRGRDLKNSLCITQTFVVCPVSKTSVLH